MVVAELSQAVAALATVGARAWLSCGCYERARRGLTGLVEDPRRTRPEPRPRTSTATPHLLSPDPRLSGPAQSRRERTRQSRTLHLTGSRSGATIARRDLCSIIHARSCRGSGAGAAAPRSPDDGSRPVTLHRTTAATASASRASPSRRHGRLRPHCLHCHTCRRACITPTSRPPQNPSGQRHANRYSPQPPRSRTAPGTP